ncbi:hypothetical protein Gotur_033508 [Gossypium turneri]
MPRRRLRDLSIQNPPNPEETNSEQQTAIRSLNVLNTANEPAEVQSNVNERFVLEVSNNYVMKALGKKMERP